MSIELKRNPTDDEVEQICVAAEEAAKKQILSTVPLKRISDFDVTVEANGDKPLVLNVDIAIDVTIGDEDLEQLVKDATNAAFNAAEMKVRELSLCANTQT
jgi:DNA-binding protein YbaB